jgi:hypothetical protein
MANETLTFIGKITVGAAGAASVTFSNIPQTGYTDLKIVVSARTTVALIDTYFNCNFNGDAGANYSQRSVYQGNTANAVSNSFSAANNQYVNSVPGANATASTFSNVEMYIPNYAGATYKSMSQDGANEHNAANPTTRFNPLSAGLWSSTAAITSIALSTASGTWVQYSTFSLYGVTIAGTTPTVAPKAAGGDTITTDGTYWYHTFISSGTFTPTRALTCSYLVVAGGGGAGGGTSGSYGGGGGAGGMLSSASLALTTTSYTVTVGAGGTGGAINTDPRGINGNDSVFGAVTATGGGGGGSGNYVGGSPVASGGNGGSGGGSGYASTAAAGGTGTAGQGNNGASYNAGGQAGGGGGAGSAGSTNTGGTGLSNSYSGSAVTYAAGGSGGGGSTNANAAANTGNGGDINTTTRYGMNGGSGIVIVRYPV